MGPFLQLLKCLDGSGRTDRARKGAHALGVSEELVLHVSEMGKITSFCGNTVLLQGILFGLWISRRKGSGDQAALITVSL